MEKQLTGIIGEGGYQLLGVGFFVLMAVLLFKVATGKETTTNPPLHTQTNTQTNTETDTEPKAETSPETES